MADRPRPKLTAEEIARAFMPEALSAFPPVLDVAGAALLLRIPRKTLYSWASQGRLDGAFRKRGKRMLFWRDRLVALVFDGPRWRI